MTTTPEPLRILFATPAYWPATAFGGPISVFRELAGGLASRGHAVTVVTASLEGVGLAPGRRGATRELDGATIYYLATPLRYRWMGITPILPLRLERLLRPDVAHVFGFRDFVGTAVAAWCRARGVPYAFEPLGMFAPKLRKLALKRVLDATLYRHVPSNAAVAIATSERERRELLRALPEARLAVRPNGFPAPRTNGGAEGTRRRLGLDPEDHLVLYVGRLARGKGLELLVDVLPRLPDAHLVIVGPDDGHGLLGELHRRSAEAGLRGRVHIVGVLPHERVASLQAAADVLALPSRHENFGMVVAEAASVGTPSVVTEDCGIADLVRDRAALVVRYDAEEVREALARLLSDADLRARLSAGGLELAGEISWRSVVDLQEKLYRKALAGRA